jgi:Holliday junction resolvase-like predicted endonuclease
MQAGSVSMGGRGSRRPAFRAKKLSNEGCPVLDDAWVMIRGYRNRRGETDHVLVGPGGVWAVEVKRRRIRLHATGENAVTLDSQSCERIVALIRRDHQFHERRRGGSGVRGDRRG